jgi:hypothetical protein
MKKTLCVLGLLLTVLQGAWCWSGCGTADAPYLIYNKEQLQLLADRVNADEGANNYSDKVFRQMLTAASFLTYVKYSELFAEKRGKDLCTGTKCCTFASVIVRLL